LHGIVIIHTAKKRAICAYSSILSSIYDAATYLKKFPVGDWIPAVLTQAESETFQSEVH
jgi:hypothetical protein